MKLVREYINEKFSEDIDPVHAMGIGEIPVEDIMKQILAIDKKHKKKIAYINAKYLEHFEFVMMAKNITKQHIYYLKKIIKEAGYLDFFSFSKRINHNIFFSIKDQYKKIIKNNSYISIEHQINEKFEETTDPVKDLGIGETTRFEKALHNFIYNSCDGYWSDLDKIQILKPYHELRIDISHDSYNDNFNTNFESYLKKSGFIKYVIDYDVNFETKIRDFYYFAIKPEYLYIVEGIDKIEKIEKKRLNFGEYNGHTRHTYDIKIIWK